MPTVLYFDCSACLTAHSCSSARFGDLYSSVRPSSAACKCGSPVPAYQTSYLGFAFSAASCAIDSPEPFWVRPTLMPVSFVNCAASASHQGMGTLQMTLTCPCACSGAETMTKSVEATQKLRRNMRFSFL